jgi:hypothetical protein
VDCIYLLATGECRAADSGEVSEEREELDRGSRGFLFVCQTRKIIGHGGQYLPANTFSFGIDFKGGGSFATEPYTFTLFSGATNLGTFLTTATSNSAYSFIGFSSLSDPITAVQIQVTGAIGAPQPVIDNVTFSSSVPEPSTWFSIMAGCVILLAWQVFGLEHFLRL